MFDGHPDTHVSPKLLRWYVELSYCSVLRYEGVSASIVYATKLIFTPNICGCNGAGP